MFEKYQLLFGGPLTGDSRDGVIEVGYHSLDDDCYSSPYTRNFALPALSRAQVNDGKIKVSLGMDVYGQDKVIGYWTITLPIPECSDVTDWAAAATEEGWSCTVDDQEYEYADFHILNTIGNNADICADGLPIRDDAAIFCEQSDGVVRGIFDWSNTRKGTDNEDDSDGEGGTASDNRELDWLDTIERFGSRSRGDIACPVDGETVAGRCANQLKSASQAFLKMAGPGGPAIAALDISNLTKLRSMFSGRCVQREHWRLGHDGYHRHGLHVPRGIRV